MYEYESESMELGAALVCDGRAAYGTSLNGTGTRLMGNIMGTRRQDSKESGIFSGRRADS